MRAIKFRVWNTFAKQMHSWEEMKEHGDFYRLLSRGERYPIMQFTGLKDMNGKEIYDGDIVHCSHYTDEANHHIAIGNCGAWFMVGSDGYAEILVDDIKSVKVIGNIHENPDLLECGNE